MVALSVALALTAALQSPTELKPLPCRPLLLEPFVIPANNLVNFDLLDARAELSNPPAPSEEPPRTVFGIKRHVGLGAGYDSGVLHGSIGLYLTIAELGRWNFGIPSPAVDSAERKNTLQAEAGGGENAVNDSDQPGVHPLPALHQFPRMNCQTSTSSRFSIRAQTSPNRSSFSFSRK